MRLTGTLLKVGGGWELHMPLFGGKVVGNKYPHQRDELYASAKTFIECLSDDQQFKVEFHINDDNESFEVSSNDTKELMSLVLETMRNKTGLTIKEVSKVMGYKSDSSYHDVEMGKTSPSFVRMMDLLKAVSPEGTNFIITTIVKSSTK